MAKAFTDFIVVQEPKMQYRRSHVLIVVVVVASSKAAAVRMSGLGAEESGYYKKPQARDFAVGQQYRF